MLRGIVNKFIDYFIVIWRDLVDNICNMKIRKEYVLVGCGGMNSECRWFEGRYDDLNEVFELGLLDNNDVRFRNSFKEEYWESYEDFGLWCDDDYEELDKEDGIIKRDDKIVRYYLINEGCELLEVEKIG